MTTTKKKAVLTSTTTVPLSARIAKREITVTISKTVQIKQFEPVSVTVTERCVLDDEDASNNEAVRVARNNIYNGLSKAVQKMVNREIEVYTED